MRPTPERKTSKNLSWQLLLLLSSLLLCLLLYWPTLSQPYFWDDAPHYDFATTRTFAQIWTDVRGLSYYRPLTFTLYKLLFEAVPPGETTPAHLLLLFVHSVNAWLVGNLLQRLLAPRAEARPEPTPWALGLTFSQMAGLLAGLLFVTYPFGALPVSHFAAFMHPLVTFFILGSTLSTILFLTTGRLLWLSLALAQAILAPFVHESGVMAGTVAMTAPYISDWHLARSRWKLLLLLPVASIIFLPVWWLVPKTPNTFEWTGWGGILASSLFFAQGPTFPIQPLSRLIMDHLAQSRPGIALTVVGLPLRDLATIGMMSLLALAMSATVLWRTNRLRILGISLAWTALVTLPSIVVLPFPYITVSQRLLYSTGPAAAILWATVCISLAGLARHPGIRAALAASLACLVAVVPMLYVQREMALHELALRPLEELAEVAREYPEDRHLVMNALNWINYRQPWYALGQEGVSVSADYVDFERLVQVNSGNRAAFAAATYPAIRTELMQLYYSTIGEEAPWDATTFRDRAYEFDRIWLTAYGNEAARVLEVGTVGHELEPGEPKYVASFDDKVHLLEASLEVDGQTATASLRWKYGFDLGNITVFRHLYNCSGDLIGQGDGHAIAGMLPWDGLVSGTEVIDIRHIPLEVVPEDGCYRLGVGLYSQDGQRVPAQDSQGMPLADFMVSLTFVPGIEP